MRNKEKEMENELKTKLLNLPLIRERNAAMDPHMNGSIYACDIVALVDDVLALSHPPAPLDAKMDDLAELKRLMEEATVLPWRYGRYGGVYEGDENGSGIGACKFKDGSLRERGSENEQFIVAACNAIPALIAEIEQLRDRQQRAPQPRPPAMGEGAKCVCKLKEQQRPKRICAEFQSHANFDACINTPDSQRMLCGHSEACHGAKV
jgi:hypothetical protein